MARDSRRTPPSSLPPPTGQSGLPRGLFLFLGAAAIGFIVGGVWLRASRQAVSPAIGPEGPRPSSVPEPETRPLFTDVTDAAGIRFVHENGATGRFYYPEVMGAGCAFFDADGDGDLDIYFVNGQKLPPETPKAEITNALYVNDGKGGFSDRTREAGVGDAGYGQGACAADYDGDGDQDLYVTNFGPNVLYRNTGGGVFERIESVVCDPGWGQSCAFFDANGDGFLDLYAQNYLEYSLADQVPWPITIDGREVLDYCSPSGYRGQQDRLYLNQGDGSFRDATSERGIVVPEGTGMGLVIADFDADGDMDIVVANDSRPNFYFRNDGKGRFTECALTLGLAYNVQGGKEAFMGVDAGDYDGDLKPDLVVPSLRSEGFNLYRNLGESFVDVSGPTGVAVATSAVTGFAPAFIDYDLDGDLDLFFTTGEVRMGRVDSGVSAAFTDRYAMQSLLLENRGGRFVDASRLAGTFFQERRISRACSAGDYDNDGDLDLLVTSMGGKPALLRNDTKGGNWIGFALVGRPPNRDAVGARLRLGAGGRERMSQVFAGGSYLGQRDRRQVFGLGKLSAIEELVVRWPSGKESRHRDLAIGRYHVLEEEKS